MSGVSGDPRLAEVLENLWAMLFKAARSRHGGFHTPAVASLGPDGMPQVRTVVLRNAARDRAELTFHTDRRSPKVAQLKSQPRVQWLFYDAQARTQLRVDAIADIISEGPVKEARWEASHPMSRECYRVALPPSSQVDRPESIPAPLPNGHEHFCVVHTRVIAIDWLYLHHQGHRRARFEYNDAGIHATWLVP
jgi:pyridoxine/pyridoxamine 5'-phosphate oxidase